MLSGQELALVLLATFTLEAVPLSAYAPFPPSAMSKCILEAVFCEAVQHSLWFCLHHLSCVKMAAIQLYLQSGKQKSGVGGGRQSSCFWSNIPW
jgi:hypothetical protein